jgi:hypothetical protein
MGMVKSKWGSQKGKGATNVELLTIDGWGAVTIDTETNGENT